VPVQEAIIEVVNPANNYGGTAPYTYRLIDDNNTPADDSDDTLIATTTSTAYSNFENLTEGSYVVEIEDDNNCTSVFSDDIDIAPLSTVTFGTPTIPTLVCAAGVPQTTGDIQISAMADNGGTIEGYRIFSVDGVPVTTPAPFTDNTTGLFTGLTQGQEYVFEASTVGTGCTEVTAN